MKLITALCVIVGLNTSIWAALPDNYQSLSAMDKQDILWENITADAYAPDQLPTDSVGFSDIIGLLSAEWLLPTFNHVSDEIPLEPNGELRKKLIHTYGSVAKVSLNITEDHPYTGIFASGALGLMRASLATQFTGGWLSTYTPGMALKFLIDRKPSVNLHVMNSLEGQGHNTNFFAKPFSSDLEEPTSFTLKILGRAFTKAVKMLRPDAEPTHLDLDHMATFDRYGFKDNQVVSPYIITFMPANGVWLPQNSTADLRNLLGRLNPGRTLYKVLVSGEDNPTTFKLIGELVLESDFVASEYGDKVLFFQHHLKR